MSNDDFERDPIARELRASLARHAAQAPRGDMLAERIIHAADQASAAARPRRRTFRVWALPLVAAGAVGAVVTAVVAIENYHPGRRPVAGSTGTVSVSVAPSVSPANSTAVSPTTAAVTKPAPVTDQTGVSVLDLTFVGPNEGWALVSANCLGRSGICTALLHTTDGERWPSVPNPTFDFNVPGITGGCTDPCVHHVRFVNPKVGYAFGPTVLSTTSDGGATWSRQKGLGALALESAFDKVIRVFTSGGQLKVATADIGSPAWRETPVGPAAGPGRPVQLTLNYDMPDPRAYLLAGSTLYRSDDKGASWHQIESPCAGRGPIAVSAGGGDRIAALCGSQVAISSDAGQNWSRRPGVVPTGARDLLAGDPKTVLATAGTTGLATSVDGGASWTPASGVTGPAGFLGFEDAQHGRAVSKDGKTIWTTSDGGRSWSHTVLP